MLWNGTSLMPIERAIPVHVSFDLGISDSTSLWFAQFTGKEDRQLGDIRRNAPCFVHREHLGVVGLRFRLARIDLSERLACGIFHYISTRNLFGSPGRREAARYSRSGTVALGMLVTEQRGIYRAICQSHRRIMK